MIAFQNVSFGYNRRRKVFADLSLTFGEGHIHGLLGRNGTGKSTLLQLICGLLEPDTGHIAVDGFTPRQRSVDFLSRLMLIPEELSLPIFHSAVLPHTQVSSTPVIQQKCSKVIAKHSKSIRHKIPTTCPWASAKKATSPSHSPAIHSSCYSTNRPTVWTSRRKQSYAACWRPTPTRNAPS